MKNKNQFEVRDTRKKEKFIIDDAYLNGWAKQCGIYATGVYMSLCRHAGKDQKCWPSLNTIAEELNISKMSVRRGLDQLIKYKIITKERVGKKMTNRYILLDKQEWECVLPQNTHNQKSDSSHRTLTVSPQNTHYATTEHSIERKHKKGNTRKVAEASSAENIFNLNNYLKSIIEDDKKRHVQIIGIYAKAKKVEWENKEQANSFIKRNLRPAKNLIGYSFEVIIHTMQYLIERVNFDKWTLETVGKYIDEESIRNSFKNKQKKQKIKKIETKISPEQIKKNQEAIAKVRKKLANKMAV